MKIDPLALQAEQNILLLRKQRVMLSHDLARLYGVPVKVLNQAVSRNRERFPDDFMFQLDPNELEDLKSQIVTSSWGGSRVPPYAFTEQGVAMLSSKRSCHPLPHQKAGKGIATKTLKERAANRSFASSFSFVRSR